MNIKAEFSTLNNLFLDFNHILSEIHDIVKKIENNRLNESLGFIDLLEDEDLLLKRLSILKSKLKNLKIGIENHLNVLTRLLNEHVKSLSNLAIKQFDRSLVDIMIQNIQAEVEFESIQKLSDEFLSSEEVGLNDIEIAKRKLDIAIVKVNKQNNIDMMTISEARSEAWSEIKNIEFVYRKK